MASIKGDTFCDRCLQAAQTQEQTIIINSPTDQSAMNCVQCYIHDLSTHKQQHYDSLGKELMSNFLDGQQTQTTRERIEQKGVQIKSIERHAQEDMQEPSQYLEMENMPARQLQRNKQVESYLEIRLHQLKEHDISIINNIRMVEYSIKKSWKNRFEDDSGNFQKKVKMSILLMEEMQLGIQKDRQQNYEQTEEEYINYIEKVLTKENSELIKKAETMKLMSPQAQQLQKEYINCIMGEQFSHMNAESIQTQLNSSSSFIKDQLSQQYYKKEIATKLVGHLTLSTSRENNKNESVQLLSSNDKGVKGDYLLLKLGHFFTSPDLPIKRNLESIIDYSHSRSTTDISAIFMALNAQEKSLQEFVREIQKSQLSQDIAARLADIISDRNLNLGILIVGNKRNNLRPHESILHSISQVTQIGEQSFFLPESFAGTSQETQRISAILEDELLKLVPLDLNRLQIKQEGSAPQPLISSILISRLSLRRIAKQESQIINYETFTEQLKEVTKDPLQTGITQLLIQEAAGKIHDAAKATSQESESQNKRDHVQGELDLVSDDYDSAYMRQVKRLLICDCESGERGGKLIAIQGLRDSEEIINSMLSVLYQKKPSDVNTGIGLPKLIIIASQNKRLEQIQNTIEEEFIKEATDPPFKLKKSQVSKAQKQNAKKYHDETFKTIFYDYQVFVLLDRKFFQHLMYGEIDITQLDYLIFDEVHSIYPESTYVDIMNKFIFNHDLMLSPPGQFEQKMRLPKVLAFFSLDSVLQAAQNNDEQIFKKFYFMANTFNASLLCLQKQELVMVKREIVRQFSQSRARNIQDISYLGKQVQNCLEFLQKIRKYLTFRRDGKNRVVCLTGSIINKKKLNKYLQLETRFAKMTLDEAIYILQDFGSQLLENLQNYQKDQQNSLYKPILESAQWVNLKVRYFSSRIQFDQRLHQLLGNDNINTFSTKLSIASQQNLYEKQTSWLYSPRLYLKKTQSESQAALEMCKILYKLGFIDKYLRPAIVRPSETIQLDGPSTNESDQKSLISSQSQQQEYEEEKTSMSVSSHFLSTNASSQIENSDSVIYNSYQRPPQSIDTNSSQTQKEIQNSKQMLPRVIKISNNQQLEEKANVFFKNNQQENQIKLDEGIKKGQHHMPIMKYNTRQLKLFIKTILNPILKAIYEYNSLCDTQEQSDLIRFDDQKVNMISESSIKELLYQQCFCENQAIGASRKINETFIQFKNYRQRMFNIYDKNNDQKNEYEYPYLVQLIDGSLESYKFPHYMTKHVENYHREEIGKPSKSTPKEQEVFNRKTFLTMLMIALSDKEPTTKEFEKVKNEMGRLAFVGDSIIILCQVITMIFNGRKSFTEKDLDAVKNKTIKTVKLKQRAEAVGLDYLIIQAKYYQKTAPNPQIEGLQKSRDLTDIIKSLAGVFSIYLGFSATFLLLSDFGIIEPTTTDSMIEIGKISNAQKVEILKTISKNRKDLLNYEQDKKRQLFDILCNQKYPGLSQEPLSGTEIVEVWKKLVKSRGLFMKHDLKQIFPPKKTADINEDFSLSQIRDSSTYQTRDCTISHQFNDDDSLKQLRDKSISLSYYSSSTDSLHSVTQSTKQIKLQESHIESLGLQAQDLEEEKSRAYEPSVSQGQDIIQNVDHYSTLDTASVSTYLKTRCSKHNSDGQTIEGDEDQSKTGGEEVDEEIVDNFIEPSQRQLDTFERDYKKIIQKGYEFKDVGILMQSIVHKSYSEKLQNSGALFKDSSLIENDLKIQFNLQILEYLGDSILNFTISKLFYCETVENNKKWHGDFFVPTKLHELKTWFSSNNWLSFALYENYYYTITEEVPGDPHFQNSEFSKKAQESIQKLQNKKVSENEAIEVAPRVPLIYDQSDLFQKQINKFNWSCFKQCLAADKNEASKIRNNPMDQLKVTCKSLSMKLFKDKDVQQQDQNEVDFYEVEENFVKYFSDVMEALIGGIFMDSGDLDKTQMILLKLINCPSVKSFPIVQHDRTAVLSVFNSKPYCRGIKLTHTIEEKDGNIYIMGFMDQLQFRRLKYSKERKRKVQLFYYDMRLYLEDAYKNFEMQFFYQRKKDDKSDGPTNKEWINFNQNYRKTWKVTPLSNDTKRYSAIKEAAKLLCKFVYSKEENFRTRENQNIPEMRDQIIMYLNQGLNTIGANMKNSLLILESERVQSSRIRELLHSSDIKIINGLAYGMKDVGDFIQKLNNSQVKEFYEHLIEFGKD